MSTKDLKHFFGQFSNSLQVLAREGRHIELRSRMEMLSELLELWLSVVPKGRERPQRFKPFALFDRFNGPLDIDVSEIAKQGAVSGDEDTVQTLANSFARLAFRCLLAEQYALAQEYLDALTYLYYQCKGNDNLLKVIGDRLDTILDSLLSSATFSEKILQGEPSEEFIASLRFALQLLYAAIYLRRPRDAGHFLERILQVREHHGRNDSIGPPSKLSLNGNAVLDYVFVLAIGWALEILQSANSKYHLAAQKILGDSIRALPSREMLIAEWELLRDDGIRDRRIDAQLGVSNWDASDWDLEIRPGIVTTRWGGGDWHKRGLRAALLLTKEHSWQDVDELCGRPANRYAWDVNAERDALENLSSVGVLSVPENERQKRIEAVLALISKRARGGDATYLRYVIDTPLSEKRTQSFEQQALESWAQHRAWIDALRDKVASLPEQVAMPLVAESGRFVPREYLLDDNNWVSGFGSHLGEAAGMRECVNLFGTIEEVATAGESIHYLARLPELIRRAVRTMSDDGLAPDLLVLPREERFAGALFRKPLWQIEGRRQYGSASIGDWEGLHVLRCPYTNPKAILLIDTAKALAGPTTADPTHASIIIDEEPENEDANLKREAAKRALDDAAAELPKSSDIVVLARMKVEPAVGIANAAAVLKLSIENSDGGFAITEDSDLYHRPSCPDIEYEDVEYVLQAPNGSDRKPCPNCQPEKWNMEGRLGQIETKIDPKE